MTTSEKLKAACEMADTIRALCRALGSPIPKDWSDAEVLAFARKLIEESRT